MGLKNFEGFRGWGTLGKAFTASGWTSMIKPYALAAYQGIAVWGC